MGSSFSNSAVAEADAGAFESMSCGDESNTKEEHDELNDDDEECFYESHEELMDHRSSSSKDELLKFKADLAEKREERRKILSKVSNEMTSLREDLQKEKLTNEHLAKENNVLRELLRSNNIQIPDEIVPENNEIAEITNALQEMSVSVDNLRDQNKKLRIELSETNLSLQTANSEMANMNSQNAEALKQIAALKEVVTASKTLIKIREEQLEKVSGELKQKVEQIQKTLADRESKMLSTDLRVEYEKQLQNIRDLRLLYEERARLAEITKRNLVRELDEQKLLSEQEVKKCKELAERIDVLEITINELKETIIDKNEEISVGKAETKGLQAEMSAINKLFTQMLLGHKSAHNLDKLVSRLEENHALLTQMVSTENSFDESALPKLLLDIVNQVDEAQEKEEKEVHSDSTDDEDEEDSEKSKLKSPEEIVDNLPKVWRVLLELLSHQTGTVTPNEIPSKSCYKSVDTPSGPRMVPSVSQTYIRLKDLIVEKMSLVKETNKMKQLNTHLETRLKDQERRLCLVTAELTKTWHVVGRLRRHHHQLHTHEKILIYELQQKRKLLNEIKEELDYCKEKWDKAKQKNNESEKEWKKLKLEFSSRRNKVHTAVSPIVSAESGYSDERQSEDDSSEWVDESECVEENPIKTNNNKKIDLHDSSTDFNLLAEGEDPISDMHDIADLPLDGHDTEEFQDKSIAENRPFKLLVGSEQLSSCESLSESSQHNDELLRKKQEAILKSKNLNENNEASEKLTRSLSAPSTSSLPNSVNTEALFPCVTFKDSKVILLNNNMKDNSQTGSQMLENISHSQNLTSDALKTTNNSTEIHDTLETPQNECLDLQINVPTSNSDLEPPREDVLITPAQILENVRLQNERLARRDERLQNLESGCQDLLTQAKKRVEMGNSLLENTSQGVFKLNQNSSLSNVPSYSNTSDPHSQEHVLCENNNMIERSTNEEFISPAQVLGNITSLNSSGNSELISQVQESPDNSMVHATHCSPAQILENVRIQNERLARRNERLQNLESGCKDLLTQARKRVEIGNSLIKNSAESSHNICSLTNETHENANLTIQPTNEDISSSAQSSENVCTQNERLTLCKERLQHLDMNCKDILTNAEKTVEISDSLGSSATLLEPESNVTALNTLKSGSESLSQEQGVSDLDNFLLPQLTNEEYISPALILENVCMRTSIKHNDAELSNSQRNLVITDNTSINKIIARDPESHSNLGEKNQKGDNDRPDKKEVVEQTITNAQHVNSSSEILKDAKEVQAEVFAQTCNKIKDKTACNDGADSFVLRNESTHDFKEPNTSLQDHARAEIPPDSIETTTQAGNCSTFNALGNNHEARFAARDERLKMLEEQTKSLVSKVNDTTSKSVKLTYKLEELHNIYGSQDNGTDSDDNDEL